MTCKCLEELPEKILAHCNQPQVPKQPLVLEARFKDVVFPMRNGQITSALKADVLLMVEGRKTPKKTTMTFIYCPFCSTRYQDNA
jgi:hypothetical protein